MTKLGRPINTPEQEVVRVAFRIKPAMKEQLRLMSIENNRTITGEVITIFEAAIKKAKIDRAKANKTGELM